MLVQALFFQAYHNVELVDVSHSLLVADDAVQVVDGVVEATFLVDAVLAAAEDTCRGHEVE